MKKNIVAGLVGIAIAGCLPESKTGTVAIKPSAQVSATATQPYPVPTPTAKTYETVENNGGHCLNIDFEQVKPALKYPVDLAVSPDGSKIYILNKRCGDYRSTRPEFNQEPFLFSDCPSYSKDSEEDPRSFIYELDSIC